MSEFKCLVKTIPVWWVSLWLLRFCVLKWASDFRVFAHKRINSKQNYMSIFNYTPTQWAHSQTFPSWLMCSGTNSAALCPLWPPCLVTLGLVWYSQTINNSPSFGIWLFSLQDAIFLTGWWLKRRLSRLHTSRFKREIRKSIDTYREEVS